MPDKNKNINVQILGENNIITTSGGNFIGKSASAPTRASNIARPTLVVGRDKDIQAIKSRLGINGSLKPITVVRGWPGSGKTTLALAIAYDSEIANLFPDGFLWVSIGQEASSILLEMAGWGRMLGTDEILKVKSIEEAQKILSALLRNKRMLIFIDDVWKTESAIPFMVGGKGCATIITTRLPIVAQEIAPTPNDVYLLSGLSEESSLSLLNLLAPTVVAEYPKECLELIKELEGLPLALQVAGRLLNSEASYGFNIKDLLEQLREGSMILASKAPADLSDLSSETIPTVAALLQESVNHLDNNVREYYAYLGVFAPKPASFDLDALKAVWQVEDPKPITRELVERGLLEYIPITRRFEMNSTLVKLARSLLIE